MRGQEFRARDKKVQKMTRDGLTEKNLTAGTEQRISGRLADVSFGREKTEDTAAGHRAKSRTQKTMRGDGASARDTGKEAEGRNQSKAVQHRMAKEVAAAEERPDGEAAAMGENGLSDMPENGHICETGRVKPADASKIRADRKKRAAAKFSDEGKKPEKAARLRYEKSEIPPEERAGDKAPEVGKDSGEKGAAKPRRVRQYEKAQRRVEKAEGILIKAQENLPTRTHVRLQKERDGESGKVKRRLHFETEVIPENEKPPLVKRAGRAAGRTAYTAAVLKAHQKIRETEADNVGVEASHKAEFAAERGAGAALRKRRRRLKEKPYREARRAQGRLAQANVDMVLLPFYVAL